MNLTETKKAKLQYHTTKITKDGGRVQNCNIALTKSLIEEMGFYEGGFANVEYDVINNRIIITPSEED